MKLASKRPKLAAPSLAAFSTADSDDETPGDTAGAQQAEQDALTLKATGQEHAERGEWSQALITWDRALALNTSTAHELYELKAQVLIELGRDFDAIQSATKATSLAPQFAEGFLTLGRAQLNMGEPKLALKSFQRVLQLQPDHVEAKDELSVVQMLSMQQERAGPGRRAVVESQGLAEQVNPQQPILQP